MNQTSSKCDSATESLPSFHQLPESHHAVCRRLEAHASAGCGTASKPRFSPPIARIFHHESALDICLSSVKTCQNMSKCRNKRQERHETWTLCPSSSTFSGALEPHYTANASTSGNSKVEPQWLLGFSQGTTIVLLNEAALRELNRFSGAICQVTEHDEQTVTIDHLASNHPFDAFEKGNSLEILTKKQALSGSTCYLVVKPCEAAAATAWPARCWSGETHFASQPRHRSTSVDIYRHHFSVSLRSSFYLTPAIIPSKSLLLGKICQKYIHFMTLVCLFGKVAAMCQKGQICIDLLPFSGGASLNWFKNH